MSNVANLNVPSVIMTWLLAAWTIYGLFNLMTNLLGRPPIKGPDLRSDYIPHFYNLQQICGI